MVWTKTEAETANLLYMDPTLFQDQECCMVSQSLKFNNHNKQKVLNEFSWNDWLSCTASED